MSHYLIRSAEAIHPDLAFLNDVILKESVVLSRLALATYEASLDGTSDDMTVVDATTLRRQVSVR